MNRRVLKYYVAAVLFSATFLFGDTKNILANTYDNFTHEPKILDGWPFDVDRTVEYDNSDLVITNNSKIKFNPTIEIFDNKSNNLYIDGMSLLVSVDGDELLEKSVSAYDIYNEKRFNQHSTQKYETEDLNTFTTVTKSWIRNVPDNMSYKMYLDYRNIVMDPYKTWTTPYPSMEEVKKRIEQFNAKYKTNLIYEPNGIGGGIYNKGAEYSCIYGFWQMKDGNVSFNSDYEYFTHDGYYDEYHKYLSQKVGNVTYLDYSHNTINRNLSVSNNSIFEVEGAIINGNTIKVTNNSILRSIILKSEQNAFSPESKIECKNMITDGDILSTDMTYVIDYSNNTSRKYTSDFLSTDAICAFTINVADSIISRNIKSTGLVKSNALNVAAINAATASITGNQSISGVFTAAGQAKLNGGAALGNKKISSLSAGTLSATSTDAVNGSQLNTIKQKLANTGKSYSAGSDVAISTGNAISVAKSGVVNKGNTGIVTGGAVYKITNALNQSLDSLKASVSSHQSTLTTLSQGLSDLKSSVTNINSSVASATKNLSAQLTNRLQSDMGNLTDDGKNVIRNMVSSTLKSMNNMSVKDTTLSPVATYESKENASNTELDTIRSSMDAKADKDDLSGLSSSVASNSKQVEDNSQAIQKNASAISDMQLSKADTDGSNISVDGYSEKLGTGRVEAGNHELVNGNTVYDTLSKKADIGYVDSGLGMVSSQLDAMSQGLTRDMNRVGAGAAALAGLHPTSYDASDKLSFAYGGGHYKNANTSALGAFYHPNERTMVSVAGTIGNNDAMLSAGLSIKVGIGNSVSKVIVTPKMFSAQKMANQDMKDHLDTQSERLQQIESTLQSRIGE